MKKYIPLDFDEKGNAILGTARTTPTSNGFVPTTWAPGGGSEDEGNGIMSITISPSITTTPALESLFPIYYEDLTEEQKESGIVLSLYTEAGIIHSGDQYTATITPTADWYAADMGNMVIGNKGEPLIVTLTAETNDALQFGDLGAMDTNEPSAETQFIIVVGSIQGQ